MYMQFQNLELCRVSL